MVSVKIFKTPPDHALNVRYLLTGVPGLFTFDERCGARVPKLVTKLRSQALIGYNPQEHNPRRYPWISVVESGQLLKRVEAIWGTLTRSGGEWRKVQEQLNACDDMPSDGPWKKLIFRKPFGAGALVYGLNTLFCVHPEAEYWRYRDWVNSLKEWWGCSAATINRCINNKAFAAEVTERDPEIAALFWPSDPRERGADEVSAAAQVFEKPVTPVKNAARTETARPVMILSCFALSPEPVEPRPVIISPKELSMVAHAVHACLESDTGLWDRRMAGEGELSYTERVRLIAQHMGMDENDLGTQLRNPSFMDALAGKDQLAADFIGYDFTLVDLTAAQIRTDVFARAVNDAIEKITQDTLFGAIQELARRKSSLDYGVVMAEVGAIIARLDKQPFALIRASMHYRHLYHEYVSSQIGKIIGPPPGLTASTR